MTLIDCCGDLPQEVSQTGLTKQLTALITAHNIEATLRSTDPSDWSITLMKRALTTAKLPCTGLVEKAELREAVSSLLASLPAPHVDPADYRNILDRLGRTPAGEDPEAGGGEEEEEGGEAREATEAAAREAKEKGNVAYRGGDTKVAVKWYTMAVAICPSQAANYANRAAAYMYGKRRGRGVGGGMKL